MSEVWGTESEWTMFKCSIVESANAQGLLSKIQGVLTFTNDIVDQRIEHFEGKVDQRLCTNYSGITLLRLLGKVDVRVLGSSQAVEQCTNSLRLHSFMRGHVSMPVQALYDLGIWRRPGIVCLNTCCERYCRRAGIWVITLVCV